MRPPFPALNPPLWIYQMHYSMHACLAALYCLHDPPCLCVYPPLPPPFCPLFSNELTVPPATVQQRERHHRRGHFEVCTVPCNRCMSTAHLCRLGGRCQTARGAMQLRALREAETGDKATVQLQSHPIAQLEQSTVRGRS